MTVNYGDQNSKALTRESFGKSILQDSLLKYHKFNCPKCLRTYYKIEQNNLCFFCTPYDFNRDEEKYLSGYDLVIQEEFLLESRIEHNDFVGTPISEIDIWTELEITPKTRAFVSPPINEKYHISRNRTIDDIVNDSDKIEKVLNFHAPNLAVLTPKKKLANPWSAQTLFTQVVNVKQPKKKKTKREFVFHPVQKFGFWTLPGRGEQRTGCGTFAGTLIACRQHYEEFYKVLTHSCNKSTCPVCFINWVISRAIKAVDKFDAFDDLLALKRVSYKTGQIRHFVLSPPQNWAANLCLTKKGYRKLKKIAIQKFKDAGFIGGCIVFHSHRGKCINCNKSMKKCRCYNPMYRWLIGTHFHLLGYGFIQNAKRFESKNKGWMYKNKGIRDSVFNTICYELGHAGLFISYKNVELQAISWIGEMSNNKLKKITEIEEFTIDCPKCDEPFYDLDMELSKIKIDGFTPEDLKELEQYDTFIKVDDNSIVEFDLVVWGDIHYFKKEMHTFEFRDFKRFKKALALSRSFMEIQMNEMKEVNQAIKEKYKEKGFNDDYFFASI